MSQPDQQHKLLPQPGPWCREAPDHAEASEAAPALLRPSLAADVGPAPLPFPAAPGDPAQRRAARPHRARPGITTGRRPGRQGRRSVRNPPLWKEKGWEGPGGGSRSVRRPEGTRPPGHSRPGNGGKTQQTTRDPDGPESAGSAPALRPRRPAVPAALPRRPRLCRPRPSLPAGGGLAAAGPHRPPRSLTPPRGRLSARENTRGASRRGGRRLRRRGQKRRHSPEVPRRPAPQRPAGKSRAPRRRREENKTKTPSN
nr:uncharacterized protein LOC116156312 [Camelus dromedarius]